MPRRPAKRDVVASTPVTAATRMGGRKVAWRLASAGVLVGMTIVAGVALGGAWSSQPVEVRFRAPERPAAAPAAATDTQLVIELDRHRMKLVRHEQVAWRGDGPLDCVTGRPWRAFGDSAALVAQACVRLADGAIVSLAGRVPAGVVVDVR
jgi:hypothetical protein